MPHFGFAAVNRSFTPLREEGSVFRFSSHTPTFHGLACLVLVVLGGVSQSCLVKVFCYV